MYRWWVIISVVFIFVAFGAQGRSLHVAQVKMKPGIIADCGSPGLDDSDWQIRHIHDLPQSQAMCIRVRLTIEKSQLPDNPALLTQMLGARHIYFDGQSIALDGLPAATKAAEMPGRLDSLYLIPGVLLTHGEHLLAMQLSNFHLSEQVSRWFYAVAVVNFEQALKLPLLEASPAIFFIGALVLTGLFFQLLFWQYQRRASYQVFSLLCLLSACLLVVEHLRALFGYRYDWHMYRIHSIAVLTFIAMCLLPLFYLLFYRFNRLVLWLVVTLLALTVAVTIDPRYDAKSMLMFAVSMIICLAINLVAYKRRQAGGMLGSVMFFTILLVFVIMPLQVVFSFIEQWFAFIYFIIILTIVGTLVREMKLNRAKALTSARLESELLRRNLQPHFLMNSLMLVIEWIEYKPKAAVEFVQALSEELRMLVQFSRETQIPLTREIELCRRHLEIMSHRYSSDYQLKLNGSVEGVDIPPAIIHTQIENAFTHNKIPEGACFELSVTSEGGTVTLQLISPYQKRRRQSDGSGTGEDYIRARLEECFEQHYGYSSNAEDDRWISRITFKAK